MRIFRILLFPFALIYGTVLRIRRWLYKLNVFHSYSYKTPVICVGNLSTGGTGKTPHVEYLLRLLGPDYNLATLSRGYKRKSKGYILADESVDATIIGDEPMQFYSKFKTVKVAVAEKRKTGIENLLSTFPDLDAIILDDAYQHLEIRPSCKILLTDYARLYCHDFPLPMGNLREFRSAAREAEIVIVTKSPANMTPDMRSRISKKLNIRPEQELFFTTYRYGVPNPISPKAKEIIPTPQSKIILLTGIANPKPLYDHVRELYTDVTLIAFPDHHSFTGKDLKKIEKVYFPEHKQNTVVFSTEKDVMRLLAKDLENYISLLPVYAIPIEVAVLFDEENRLNEKIKHYVRRN